EGLAEAGFVDGLHVGFEGGNLTGQHFLPDGVVHELHPVFLAAGDDVVEFLGRTFANHGGDGGGGNEDLVDRDAALLVVTLEEELGDHPAEGAGQHGAHLRLLVRGKDVDETVDGLAGVVGVQGAEYEQSGFGGGEGERDGFEV